MLKGKIKPIKVETTSIALKVTDCVRCGKTHTIMFYKMKHKEFKNWYLGLCEHKNEPIVMYFTMEVNNGYSRK